MRVKTASVDFADEQRLELAVLVFVHHHRHRDLALLAEGGRADIIQLACRPSGRGSGPRSVSMVFLNSSTLSIAFGFAFSVSRMYSSA